MFNIILWKFFAISSEVADHTFPVVIAGGLGNGEYILDIVEVSDNNTYCKVDKFPMKIYNGEGIDGMMCGGETFGYWEQYDPVSNCWHLHPNGTWTSGKHMLEKRAYFSLNKVKDGIIAIGGQPMFGQIISSVEKYSLSNVEGWIWMRDAPIPIAMHCTVTINSSHLLVIGGYQNHQVNTGSH